MNEGNESIAFRDEAHRGIIGFRNEYILISILNTGNGLNYVPL